MESGASDHAGLNRKRIKECVLKYFDIWCRINISVKNPTPPYKMPMDFLCEECNKKALLVLNSSAKNETLPAELSIVVALPHVVHLGKSLKCSWANWFIGLEGARSNLVLIRTLRDSGSLDIRRRLKKCLTLECVRNKDRMAVEPILCITRSTVLDVLEEVTFCGSHRGARKCRFWKSNQGVQASLCKRPIALKCGT